MKTVENAPPLVTNRVTPVIRTVTVVHANPPPRIHRSGVPVSFFVVLVLLGGGLRTAALLTDRCLWTDETMLALNLVHRSPRQLLDPLDHNQGAPIGFLLAVKSVISVVGTSEWTLRLVPFAASCLGMVGFARVCRRLLPSYAALFAVSLFALSPHLVSYAGECKQYASDAAIAAGLLAVALGLLEGKGGAARWLALAGVGAAAVWCSHPATFVLGGIGSALLIRAAVSRDRQRMLATVATIACWLISFGACYLFCLKQLDSNKYLTNYWAKHFFPLPPKSLSDLVWFVDHSVQFFTQPGGFGGTIIPLGGFAAFLALIGLREFARERWPVAVAVAGSGLLVLFASGLQKYPVGGRLMLFFVPFAMLLVARGAWTVFDAIREKNRFAAITLLAVLIVAPLWESVDSIRKPMRQEELASVLQNVREELQPGDGVYVYYGAVPAFHFYTREQPLPTEDVIIGTMHRGDPAGYRDELSQLQGRVWVLVSHRHGEEETMIRAILDTRGTCERELKRPGAAAYLYQFE